MKLELSIIPPFLAGIYTSTLGLLILVGLQTLATSTYVIGEVIDKSGVKWSKLLHQQYRQGVGYSEEVYIHVLLNLHVRIWS